MLQPAIVVDSEHSVGGVPIVNITLSMKW